MNGRIASRFEDYQSHIEWIWSEQWFAMKAQELEDEADGRKDE